VIRDKGRPRWLGRSAAADQYFANVVLLAHFDGANGQTTTVDSSPKAHTISRISSAALSTAQSKFGGAAASMIGGVNCWSSADSADWAFGSGKFTVEGWFYFTAAPSGTQSLISQWSGSSSLGWFFGFAAGKLAFYYSTTGSDSPNVTTTWAPSTNAWYHIAVDRDASNVIRVYVDGVVVASATVASAFYDSTLNLELGGSVVGWPSPTGYMDEVRITKGIARYAGAFTPPTSAFPNS
jgi:hypothetical protein